ncbi:hypothetical protein [Virgibacillus profundi]|uniref:hypothetical protein n=1 Tax=Virgibacillus profundi TaxID=2024555 RepID=UPI0013FD996D|nr:hypothetical protein [Virgibacillus profundi]
MFNRRTDRDADYAHVLTIGLSYKDKSHLEKFKEFVDFSGDLYIDKDRTKITITINSRRLVKDIMEKYDITKNKTDTYTPPDKIPSHLKKYFVLGLFDSDGSMTKINRPNKAVNGHVKGLYVFGMSFTGTMETIIYIRNFFGSTVKETKRRENDSNNYTILFQGNIQLIKYGSKLYDKYSKKFCMKRKYKKYCELLEQYNIVVHDGNIMDYELVNL